MSIHRVLPGDTMRSIALKHGFRSWRALWEFPGNAELRRKRADPNILGEGDEVFVPKEEHFTAPAQTSTTNIYAVVPLEEFTRLALRVSLFNGPPLVGWSYELSVGTGRFTGSVPENGLVEHDIVPDEPDGMVKLRPVDMTEGWRYSWTLQIGHLQPVETTSGLKARLKSLGHPTGEGAELDSLTQQAMREFQRRNHLKLTELPDEPTQSRLTDVHGC